MRITTISLLLGALLLTTTIRAQTTDDILKIMVRKGTITQQEADSLRKEYNTRERREQATADSFPLRLGRSLDLSGYTDVTYTNYAHPGAGKYYDGFAIKRARLDFQGHFSSKFDYRLLFDFVGQSSANGTAPTGGGQISPFLVDAWISYKPFTWLQFKAGQLYAAFSQENTTQDRNLDMIERTQVVGALVARKGDAANGLVDSLGNQNGRDIGIQLFGNIGKLKDHYLLDYYFQVLNGAGINTLDNNQSKDIDARLVVHPLKWINIGGSYYDGYDRFTSNLNKDQLRTRWGTEVGLVQDRWSVKGEYIRGQEGVHHPTKHEGWYGQAAYFFLPKQLEGIVRYDWYDPNTAKADVKSTYYDLGLTYYFNVWTKIQVYYSVRNQQGPTINNNLFETQFQLAF